MCFLPFYIYVVLKWAIEQFGLKVAFWLADRNQMIINGYQKICYGFINLFLHANFKNELL